MLSEDDLDRFASSLDEILDARDALTLYLEDRGIRGAMAGVVGKKDDYGIIVYLPKDADPNFLIPVQIDGIPVRTAPLKTLDRIKDGELRALAKWYDTHCSVSADPIMQGPCNNCGKLGSWEADPYAKEIYDETVWNFWCERCYQERADDI